MLQKLKNKLRLLKTKWMNLKFRTRFFIIAIIIGFIIGGYDTSTNYEPLMKEENYSAIENVVTSMVEKRSTDVDFDETKIDKYTVLHKENGEQEITITGDRLEKIYLTLTNDYQIKSLTRNGESIIFLFWVLYILVLFVVGCAISGVLLVVYTIIKKIVKFFEEE